MGAFDHLTNLQHLTLDSNSFTSFPNLTAVGATLTHVSIYKEFFPTVFASQVAGLEVLSHLTISSTQMTVFPDLGPIGHTLILLDLDANCIGTISPVLLKSLIALYIKACAK